MASDTSDSIFTLKQGTKVTVVENFLNGWYKIYVNNIYGYINTKDNVSSSKGIATGDVNIRTEANTNSNIVGVLLKGSKIEIAGQSGNFYKVKYKGLYRYISKKYLSDNESEKLNNVIESSEANSLTSASCAIFNTPTLFNFSLSLSDKYFFEIYLYKHLYFTL